MQLFANLLVQQGAELPDADTVRQTLSAFTDAADIPADRQAAITLCIQHGLISGYADGTLRPQNTITRSEYARILTSLLTD